MVKLGPLPSATAMITIVAAMSLLVGLIGAAITTD